MTAFGHSLRRTAGALGLGRLLYLLWHAPVGVVRRSMREGGPVNQWIDARHRAEMEGAASRLPTSRATSAPAFPTLHFLTGRKFWYQSVFCLHSLQRHSGITFRAIFHDDGTLDEARRGRLLALFPAAEVRLRSENDARVARVLPPGRFPSLHLERRRVYPNFLKLTDVHAGGSGWQLVLDSDMLFFRRPERLLEWLAAPRGPIYMTDVADAYGYPLATMAALAGAPIPPKVNVGFCGLRSDAIDWDRLEAWTRELVSLHPHYYLEQALSAMLFASQPCTILPPDDYRLAPDVPECQAPTAVLHHYVAQSKRGYFRHAWRHLLK